MYIEVRNVAASKAVEENKILGDNEIISTQFAYSFSWFLLNNPSFLYQ